MLKTEISSIFYVLKYWLPKKTLIYNLNLAWFYLTFLKFRLIDLIYEVGDGRVVYFLTSTYSLDNMYTTWIFTACFYGLIVLNIYWFSLMTKILLKVQNY
jgi:hypothetical protein